MRFILPGVICILLCQVSLAQGTPPDANPFGPVDDSAQADSEWTPLHPDGDTPQARMLSLVHTEALPRFDRAELFAVSVNSSDPTEEASENTFPVHPYGKFADVHSRVTLTGKACDELRSAWRSLAFDRLGGAMCHLPEYGLRLYRDDKLLFETTICWKCQNFYLPQFDAEAKRYTHGFYGFANDEHAKVLLKVFRAHLPQPKLE